MSINGVNMFRIKEESLKNWLNKKSKKPLILRGARQVGKSTLVRNFADSQGLILHEVNLERHRTLDALFSTLKMDNILSELQFICNKGSLLQKNSLIFLDEIQAAPHALEALRYFHEDYPDLPVIAAGSLLEFTLSKHNFSMPVGRVEYMFLGPMSFYEFLMAKNEGSLTELLSSYQLQDFLPESAHLSLLEALREYLLVGGMPEAVKEYLVINDLRAAMDVHSSILSTYKDDFSKYCTNRQLLTVQKVFEMIPLLTGKKMKYSSIDRDVLSRDLKAAVGLLVKAGLIIQVAHSSANGIPLMAEEDSSVFKPYFLDCGLMNRSCRLEWISPEELSDARFINEGNLAEQFVCQNLAASGSDNEPPRLNYWLREKKAHNSEVDFVIQINRDIVPVEVKAGKSGTLRSVHQFVFHKKCNTALRFDMNIPSVQDVKHRMKVSNEESADVSYKLISLPLYFAEQADRLLRG